MKCVCFKIIKATEGFNVTTSIFVEVRIEAINEINSFVFARIQMSSLNNVGSSLAKAFNFRTVQNNSTLVQYDSALMEPQEVRQIFKQMMQKFQAFGVFTGQYEMDFAYRMKDVEGLLSEPSRIIAIHGVEQQQQVTAEILSAERYYENGDYKAAVRQYERVISILGNEVNKKTLPYFIALNRVKLALAENARGSMDASDLQYFRAIKDSLQQCLQVDPLNKDARVLLNKVERLVEQIGRDIERRQFQEEQQKQQAIAQQKLQEEAEAKEQSKSQNEQDCKHVLSSLRAVWSSGEQRRILSDYDKLIAKYPDYIEVYFERGIFCLSAQEKLSNVTQRRALLQKTQVDLQRVIQKDPFNDEAVMLLEQAGQQLIALNNTTFMPGIGAMPTLVQQPLQTGGLSEAQRAKLEAMKQQMRGAQQPPAQVDVTRWKPK